MIALKYFVYIGIANEALLKYETSVRDIVLAIAQDKNLKKGRCEGAKSCTMHHRNRFQHYQPVEWCANPWEEAKVGLTLEEHHHVGVQRESPEALYRPHRRRHHHHLPRSYVTKGRHPLIA